MDTREAFEIGGQGHVFAFWDELDDRERTSLLEQAEEIDLAELDSLVANLVKGDDVESEVDYRALRPAPYEPMPADLNKDQKWASAKEIGEEALSGGRVAAFTVAGGQGTRLGYDGPKGTFPVTPIANKTLFQVFAEKIRASRDRFDCQLPWYIMTSHANHEATESFFRKHEFFDLGEETVKFFRQGRMPAVDFDGRILMESKGKIAMSPDGHGGALRALDRSGALAEMVSKGIDLLSYFQVDNPHVQVADPYFLGFHIQSGSEMSSKMLPKAYEKEKLGHFCLNGDRLEVVEYSDMPDELTSKRDESGKLLFIAGSVAIHVVSVPFIQKVVEEDSPISLPFHKAVKKIACVDGSGAPQEVDAPNGVKFEMFVFDALPFAENAVIVETTRLGDFSPVKNAKGVDSADSCRKDQQKLFASWLAHEGVRLELDDDGIPVNKIEISPLFGYDQDSFSESWKARKPVVDFSKDVYIA